MSAIPTKAWESQLSRTISSFSIWKSLLLPPLPFLLPRLRVTVDILKLRGTCAGVARLLTYIMAPWDQNCPIRQLGRLPHEGASPPPMPASPTPHLLCNHSFLPWHLCSQLRSRAPGRGHCRGLWEEGRSREGLGMFLQGSLTRAEPLTGTKRCLPHCCEWKLPLVPLDHKGLRHNPLHSLGHCRPIDPSVPGFAEPASSQNLLLCAEIISFVPPGGPQPMHNGDQ